MTHAHLPLVAAIALGALAGCLADGPAAPDPDDGKADDGVAIAFSLSTRQDANVPIACDAWPWQDCEIALDGAFAPNSAVMAYARRLLDTTGRPEVDFDFATVTVFDAARTEVVPQESISIRARRSDERPYGLSLDASTMAFSLAFRSEDPDEEFHVLLALGSDMLNQKLIPFDRATFTGTMRATPR
jgi:hypothetical protein